MEDAMKDDDPLVVMASRYSEAVRTMAGITPGLRQALDHATVTGVPPDTGRMASLVDGCDMLLEELARDGLEFVDTLPFVTLRKRYAWALPTMEAVLACVRAAEGGVLVEAGSGTGYWAAVLSSAGVSVVAADDFSSHDDWTRRWRDPDVGTIRQAMKDNPGRPVLAVFPTETSSMEVVSRLSVGQSLVHVGGPFCTGCREYWDILEADFSLVETIPAWDDRDDPAGFVAKRKRVSLPKEEVSPVRAGLSVLSMMHPHWPTWIGSAG